MSVPFHALSDGKTVKKLTWDKYLKISVRSGWLCGWVSEGEILFIKGSSIIYLTLEQLDKILQLKEA